MVRDLHLAGVSVTSDNVVDRDQVLAMTAALADAAADGRARLPAGDRRGPGGRLRLPPARHRHRLPALPVRRTRDPGRRAARAPGHPRGRPDDRARAARARLHLGLRPGRRRHHRRRRPDHRRALAVGGPAGRGAGDRRGDQGLRRRRHRLDRQALPGPRHRHDRQPRRAAGGRLDAGRDRGARPAALRVGDRPRGTRGDDEPPRPDLDRPGRAGEHGARGLRPAARRPRLRGRHHHRLARHGCRRRPAHPGAPGARGRRRPAADAGRHRRRPTRSSSTRSSPARSPASASRRPPPGWSPCRCGRPGWQHNGPCPADVVERAQAASADLESAAY